MLCIGWLVLFLAMKALAQQVQQPLSPIPSADESQSPQQGSTFQLTPRSHEEREARYRAQHRITLDVLVTDAAGKPITGLSQDAFSIFDHGEAQKITLFHAMRGDSTIAPAHVILILDAVNNSKGDIGRSRKHIQEFLKEDDGPLDHPISIAVLSAAGLQAGLSTRDRGILRDELKALTSNIQPVPCSDDSSENTTTMISLDPYHGRTEESTHGANCLNRRFIASVTALIGLVRQQQNVPGRAFLVWIGPGWPLLTGREFQKETPDLRWNHFDHLVELSDSLRIGEVTLDAISSPDQLGNVESRKIEANPSPSDPFDENNVTASSLSLHALALQSGGRILRDENSTARDIAACLADASAYYRLSFDSKPATRPHENRPLQVNLNLPGATVRTIASYFAEP